MFSFILTLCHTVQSPVVPVVLRSRAAASTNLKNYGAAGSACLLFPVRLVVPPTAFVWFSLRRSPLWLLPVATRYLLRPLAAGRSLCKWPAASLQRLFGFCRVWQLWPCPELWIDATSLCCGRMQRLGGLCDGAGGHFARTCQSKGSTRRDARKCRGSLATQVGLDAQLSCGSLVRTVSA